MFGTKRCFADPIGEVLDARADYEDVSFQLSAQRDIETETSYAQSPPRRELLTPKPHQLTPETERVLELKKQGLKDIRQSHEKQNPFKREKQHIDETLDSMRRKHEESKRALLKFKIDKFCAKVDLLFVKKSYKYQKLSLMILSSFSNELGSKLRRVYRYIIPYPDLSDAIR